MLALRELGTWVLGVVLALSQVVIQFRGGEPSAQITGAAVTLAVAGLYPHARHLWSPGRTPGRSPSSASPSSRGESSSSGGDDDPPRA